MPVPEVQVAAYGSKLLEKMPEAPLSVGKHSSRVQFLDDRLIQGLASLATNTAIRRDGRTRSSLSSRGSGQGRTSLASLSSRPRLPLSDCLCTSAWGRSASSTAVLRLAV